MSFDYSRLRGKIKQKCRSQAVFAYKMGLTEKTISAKLNGDREWKQGEIIEACRILGVPTSKIKDYFFKKKV